MDEISGDVVHRPDPAHVRGEHELGDELEATELGPMDGENKTQRPRLSRVLSEGMPTAHWYDPIKRVWRHEVRISVPHEDCRDHLGR